jgi:hypothetical protein
LVVTAAIVGLLLDPSCSSDDFESGSFAGSVVMMLLVTFVDEHAKERIVKC